MIGAKLLMERGVLERITPMLKNEPNIEIKLSITRALSELSKDMERVSVS